MITPASAQTSEAPARSLPGGCVLALGRAYMAADCGESMAADAGESMAADAGVSMAACSWSSGYAIQVSAERANIHERVCVQRFLARAQRERDVHVFVGGLRRGRRLERHAAGSQLPEQEKRGQMRSVQLSTLASALKNACQHSPLQTPAGLGAWQKSACACSDVPRAPA